MAQVRRHIQVVLDGDAGERAMKAARQALLTCALPFEGKRLRDVLFAVARSYTAAERALQNDESRLTAFIGEPNAQLVWKQLETAEDALCAAAEALPQLRRCAVVRLIEAAQAYSDAWDLDRARVVALRTGERSATWGGSHRAPSRNARADSLLVDPPIARRTDVIAQYRHARWPSRP